MNPTSSDGGGPGGVGPGGDDSSTGRPLGESARPALERGHPRAARLIAFAPLAVVVSVLVLLLGLPWWALLLGVAALAYVLVFHA